MNHRFPFTDRVAAGQALAAPLAAYAHRPDAVVLALPRGGVPVAFEVARALALPLDILVVRKLGVPGREELAMGAIASGGVRVLDDDVISGFAIRADVLEVVAAREQRELERRERAYRDQRAGLEVRDRIALVIDDGLATGTTMRAAIQALRQRQPRQIVVAVPVAPPEACDALRPEVDALVCLHQPRPFGGVGRWYGDFSQISDAEVRDLLARAGGAGKPRLGRATADDR